MTSIYNDSPLNASGRFGRLAFAAWTLLGGIVCLIAFAALVAIWFVVVPDEGSPAMWFFALLAIVFYVVIVYFNFVFTIRRLHDCNKSGWLSLLYLVPLLSLFFMLYLFCARGSEGANQYGLPYITQGWEKIMGWIYLIILPLAFLLGIAAAIAIPAYQDYMQNAQLDQLEKQHVQFESEQQNAQ